MPPRLIVIVAAFDEKHGPLVEVTGGTYGCVVPANGARQVPVDCTVAVTTIGACVPGLHDVDASGAVQFAKYTSSTLAAPFDWFSGRNTSVGDRSSRPSALPSVWMFVCSVPLTE